MYDPSMVLAKFPYSLLYEERAILLGKPFFCGSTAPQLNHIVEPKTILSKMAAACC